MNNITFENSENFRELGGYINKDGKRVKPGVFYRSARLSTIQSASDIARFNALGVRKIFDFRSDMERADAPDPAFSGAVNIAASAIVGDLANGGNFDVASLLSNEKSLRKLLSYLDEAYAKMPFNNEAYRQLFAAIVAQETPVLFHCTAGKDRTGCAAALILLALEVPRNIIMADYLATNECSTQSIAQFAKLLEQKMQVERGVALSLAPLFAGVRKESLEAFFAAIDAQYPQIEDYFEQQLFITPKQLAQIRENYLV